MLALAAPVIVIGAGILYVVPPEPGSSVYPPCPFHWATGLHCPGCGSLRALHALMHGHLGQALAFNSLGVLALGPLLAASGYHLWRWARPSQHPPLRAPAWFGVVVLWTVIVYAVLRNIPMSPFTLLAPHRLD